MYITIRRFKIDPELVDEVIDLAKEKFVPGLTAIPGFKAFYHLRPAEDTLVSVSVFADKTGADESNRLSQECVKDHAADLLPEPPEVIEGEVEAFELAESVISAH